VKFGSGAAPAEGRLGVYDGIAYYDTTSTVTQGVRLTQQVFGHLPDISSSYYSSDPSQITALTGNFTNERTRMGFGVDCVITWNTRISGRHTLGLKDIAAGNNAHGTDAYANWTKVKGLLQSLDAYAASAGRKVYFAIDHEGEDQLYKSDTRAPDGGKGGSYDASVTVNDYVSAIARTTKEIKALGLKNTKVVWWTSGWNITATSGYNGDYSIATVGNALAGVVAANPSWATFPDLFGFDPYMHASGTPTFTSLVQPGVASIKTLSWYKSHPVPICLPEFGAGTRVGSSSATVDAAMKGFYTDLRPQIAALDLEFATYFNRTDGVISQNINMTNYPNARAAITASLAAHP